MKRLGIFWPLCQNLPVAAFRVRKTPGLMVGLGSLQVAPGLRARGSPGRRLRHDYLAR